MKRIVASVGMVALGACGVQGASDLNGGPEPSKPWSVSAALRGFYDDNINSSGISANTTDTYGFSVSPSLRWGWTQEQTTITLGYTYSLLYYDKKPPGNVDYTDQDHAFDAALSHAFSERYRLSVADSFVIGQEPDSLRSGYAFSTFVRVPGYNIRNSGTINFDAQLTRLFGLQIGYANGYYDYAHTDVTGDGNGQVVASNAGVLNRLEHSAHLDGRWLFQPQTTGILGYQYRETDYTAGQPIAGDFPQVPGSTIFSDNRNSRSHYAYLGVDHNFRPDLTVSLRAGGSYTDFFNDPNQSGAFSPYALLNVRYTYGQDSFFEAGFSYDRAATDLTGFDNQNGKVTFTTDSQTAVVYGTWTHRITPRLSGSLTAQFQDSTYQNGALDSQSDRFYLLGLNFEYKFTPNLAGVVGYDYDKLDSDIASRGFDRNRVYLGITASY